MNDNEIGRARRAAKKHEEKKKNVVLIMEANYMFLNI